MKSPRVAGYRLLFENSLRPVTLDDFDGDDIPDLYKLGVVETSANGDFVLEMCSMSMVHRVADAIIWRWKSASLPCPILRVQLFDSSGRFLSTKKYNEKIEWEC